MKYIILFFLFLGIHLQTASAQEVQYQHADSIKVVRLLRHARHLKADTNYMIHFAHQLRGIPYVAKTLENNTEEKLVVNLRQLDCTTYVETVLALTLCARNHKTRFADYCDFLRLIRYRDGNVSYPDRLHYFSTWIDDNTRMGYVHEVELPKMIDDDRETPVQKLNINYMTTHVQLYPMLVKHPEWVSPIKSMEDGLNGRLYPYIPKDAITDNELFRSIIHDGDIIAILTNKTGLDTSHIGIAVWHKDGLHLLNASQVRHKVVEEPMTLRQYMSGHPSQTGIRIVRVNGNNE